MVPNPLLGVTKEVLWRNKREQDKQQRYIFSLTIPASHWLALLFTIKCWFPDNASFRFSTALNPKLLSTSMYFFWVIAATKHAFGMFAVLPQTANKWYYAIVIVPAWSRTKSAWFKKKSAEFLIFTIFIFDYFLFLGSTLCSDSDWIHWILCQCVWQVCTHISLTGTRHRARIASRSELTSG